MHAHFGKCVTCFSVMNIGHSHPKVVEAVQKQVVDYMHLIVYGEFIEQPQVAYAKLLTDHLPSSLNCVYFTNSGADAVEGEGVRRRDRRWSLWKWNDWGDREVSRDVHGEAGWSHRAEWWVVATFVRYRRSIPTVEWAGVDELERGQFAMVA